MHSRAERLRKAATAAGPVSFAELAVIAGALTLLAAVAFGRHVVDGGFWNDDWANAADYEFADSPRYFTSVGNYADLLGSRPLLAALLPLPYAVLGVDPTAHLLMALLLGVATCVCFYLFLRAIPLARVHAGAMASLALVFPWADSIRLWPTASVNTVALVCAFLGAFVALRGVGGEGRASQLALVGSATLYVASVLTYEVAGVALLLVGALYLLHAPRPKALRWWAIHAGVVVGALLYTVLTTEKEVGTLGDRLGDLPRYAREAVSLLSYSFVPPGTASAAPRLLGLTVVGAIVVVGFWRWRTTRDRQLGFWLAFAGASIVTIVTAYLVTLGAFLAPLREGAYNRGNLFAAYGFVTLVYALAMIAVCAAGGRRAARAGAAVAVVLIGAGYVIRAQDDAADWDRAWRLQQPVLDAAVNAVAELPRGATLFTFGAPGQVSEGLAIFYLSWDLDGAVALQAGDGSLGAYPVYKSANLVCDSGGIRIRYAHSDSEASADYRATAFLDIPTRTLRRIGSVADCAEALQMFRPGPEYAAPEQDGLYGLSTRRR